MSLIYFCYIKLIGGRRIEPRYFHWGTGGITINGTKNQWSEFSKKKKKKKNQWPVMF